MTDDVNQIHKYIAENFLFGVPESSLGNDDSFLDKGIIDSTGILEVVAWLEESFGIKVRDEELIPSNLDSVNNLAAFIARSTPR